LEKVFRKLYKSEITRIKMSKLLIGLVVLLIVGVGAFLFLSVSGSDDSTDVISGESDGGVKSFMMTGENFKFVMGGLDNPDIKVKKGDTVRIVLTSTQGLHDWVLDEFNAATAKVRETDDSTYVEFTANQVGTFEYYCSVGQHRANGMKGRFVVE
jgi:plastocyanin